MASTATGAGRPVWLELNAQRVTAGFAFYRDLFGWQSAPLHVPPWGAILNIVNGDRAFGTQFMAMGAFAEPRWLIWFAGDLEAAEAVVARHGGDAGQGIHALGALGHLLDCRDPAGNAFGMIRLRGVVPEVDQPGDPCMAELWGNEVSGLAEFYAEVLGLKSEKTNLGATLRDGDVPRVFLRDAPFDLPRPRWIPYFRTTSVGGDCERARRLGGIVQVHPDPVPGMGDLVVLADPSGACFGLVAPEDR